MRLVTFPVGPLGCNCSLLVDGVTKEAIVVDPGGDFELISAKLAELGARAVALVHTHTHIDHVGATAPLQVASGATAHIHEADRFLYQILPVQASLVGTEVPESAEMEGDLLEGKVLRAGGLELLVMHTPGHTPGSVCFVARTKERSLAFTGDTLFRRGVGRTDLWGGDSAALQKSLEHKLFSLEESTLVVPGHGPTTTIGEERFGNPFVGRRR
jgi:hydroxyacylglutathione hydrolase